jgi:hypothetical protein
MGAPTLMQGKTDQVMTGIFLTVVLEFGFNVKCLSSQDKEN